MSTNSNQVSANSTISYIGAQETKDLVNNGFFLAGNTYTFQGKSNTIGTLTLPAMGLPNFCCATMNVNFNGTDGVGQLSGMTAYRWIINASGVTSLSTNVNYGTTVALSGWSVAPVLTNATTTAPSTAAMSLTTSTTGALGVSGTLSFTAYP